MCKIKPDNRLSVIASFARKGRIVADIGTDHALLPCYLKQCGFEKIIASDIKENPLNAARETMRSYGVSGVELVLCDGLSGIDYAEDIVIAGMGGETIAEIISHCSFVNGDTRFILQPMTKHAELRRALYRMGYEILNERAARADGKIYTVIHAAYSGQSKEISDVYSFIGAQTDKEYIAREHEKLRKIIRSKPEYSAAEREIRNILETS